MGTTNDNGKGGEVMSIEARLAEARRECGNPSRVQWLVMRNPKDGETTAQAVAYISMVDLEDLLDEYIGPMDWEVSYPSIGPVVTCKLGIRGDDGRWVWREDGTGEEGEVERVEATKNQRYKKDRDMELKAMLSDAFKRVCRRWGLGRDLFRLPKPWVQCEKRGNSWVICADEYDRLAAIADTGKDPGRGQAARRPAPAPDSSRQPRVPAAAPPDEDRRGPPPRAAEAPRPGPAQGPVFTIPMGKSKGTPIEEATTEDLVWCCNFLEESIANRKSRKPDMDRRWIDAARGVIASRNKRAAGGSR